MSLSSSPVPLIPSYIATGRFAGNTVDDHAGSIWISTLLCLVYSIIVIAIRGYLRWNVFSIDDYAMLIATGFQTCEVTASIIALQHGLGKSHSLLSAVQISNTNTATFITMVLFIASLSFAKLSVILQMMRLFNLTSQTSTYGTRIRALRSLCLTAALLTIIWAIGSIIGLFINCSISTMISVKSGVSCPDQDLRWVVIGAIDIATELMLFTLSIVVVWPVRLKLSMKIPIVFAFSFRLPCAILSGLHILYVQKFTNNTASTSVTSTNSDLNPGLTIVPVILLMQVELAWSMISGTIPNLRSFVRSFNSYFSLGLDPDDPSGKHSGGSGSNSNSNRNHSHSHTSGTANDTLISHRNTEYELGRIRSYRMPSNTTTLYGQGSISAAPKRPSRQDVDIDDIGLHAGIPPIPGFGARGYVTHPECDSSPEIGSDSGGGDGGGAQNIGIAHSGGSIVSDSASQEHIIRKDMQFEVRYEMN